MNQRKKMRPGDFVALPLPSGGYAYGRVMNKLMAFYDLRTDTPANIEDVAKSEILFITAVHMSAIRHTNWQTLGNHPLEAHLQRDVRFFRKDPTGKGFLIYVSKAAPPNAYDEYKASANECRGLEPLLVWEPAQIEQRIDDSFEKKENVYLSHFMQQAFGDERNSLN